MSVNFSLNGNGNSFSESLEGADTQLREKRVKSFRKWSRFVYIGLHHRPSATRKRTGRPGTNREEQHANS